MAIISFWWDIGILLVIICQLVIFWVNRRYKYWKIKGVNGPDPVFLFGNIKDVLTLKENMGKVFMDMSNMNKCKNLPYFGAYMMFRPTLVLNDLDMIKQFLVTDFVHFTDHLFELNPKYDPLAEHLFNATGETWKNMRQKLTPTFTTNKMKYMFETLKLCSKDMDKYLGKITPENNVLNVRELLGFFSMNVILSCAFGIDCNMFEDRDPRFIKATGIFRDLNAVQAIFNFFVLFCYPEISKYLKFSIIGKETNEFFHKLVKDTIEYRNKNNITRNDFFQILMRLQEHGHVEDAEHVEKHIDDGTRLTTLQLAAQAFVFFIAGHETSSSTASFALYELALNPDIQDLVRDDIMSVKEKYDGNITYESIGEMTYLTKVVEETLRKYPPVPILIRKCTKEYLIPNTNVTIDKGTAVIIPIFGIQRDARYFPNPEKFDPERFSNENKASRPHFSYIPFGEGPRICIGNRFGLMQTKLGLISVLSLYKVSVSTKTKIPLEFNKINLLLASGEGIYLKLTRISDE